MLIVNQEYHKNITELQTSQANLNKVTGKIEIVLQMLKEIAPDEPINLKNISVKTTEDKSATNNNLKFA